MVPFRLRPEQFRERYARSLQKLSTVAIARLSEHLAIPLQPTTMACEVKVFIPQDEPFVPSVWLYYTGAQNKVDAQDTSLHPGRSMALDIGLDQLEDFDPRFFTSETFGGLDIAAKVLASWTSEMWWKAGGWRYAVPTMLSVNDGFGDGQSIALSEKASIV